MRPARATGRVGVLPRGVSNRWRHERVTVTLTVGMTRIFRVMQGTILLPCPQKRAGDMTRTLSVMQGTILLPCRPDAGYNLFGMSSTLCRPAMGPALPAESVKMRAIRPKANWCRGPLNKYISVTVLCWMIALSIIHPTELLHKYMSVTILCWTIAMSGMVAASPLLALSSHRGRLATELQAPYPYHRVTVDAWLMGTASPLLAPSSHRGRLVSPCPLNMWLQAPYSHHRVTVDAWLQEAASPSLVLSSHRGRLAFSRLMCSISVRVNLISPRVLVVWTDSEGPGPLALKLCRVHRDCWVCGSKNPEAKKDMLQRALRIMEAHYIMDHHQ